ALRGLPGVRAVVPVEGAGVPAFRVEGADGAALAAAVGDLAAARGWRVRELAPDASLEAAFIRLLRRHRAERTGGDEVRHAA
ncbi:hypothetical protein G3N55_09280, partial [Dissulfurirhabdus thermomarina]|nr:hypothetical protein [Dissulfurirhabdus thermomarina]